MYPNCQPRKKFTRRDAELLPKMCFEDSGTVYEALAEDKPLGHVRVVGRKELDGPFGKTDWEYLEVVLNDGTIVPALRRYAPENNYCICQNFNFKVVR